MFSLLLASLLLATGFAATPSPIAMPTPAPLSQAQLTLLVNSDVQLLDGFWSSQSFSPSHHYARPNWSWLQDGGLTSTGCGMVPPMTEAAFYCTQDRAIYVSPAFVQLLESSPGGLGDSMVAQMLAHEYTHHIQNVVGEFPATVPSGGDQNRRSIELQADCGSGGWLKTWPLTDHQHRGVNVLLLQVGDGPNAPQFDSHGTGQDRIDAFERGYTNLSNCQLPL